jgi:hypothetical protein
MQLTINAAHQAGPQRTIGLFIALVTLKGKALGFLTAANGR